MKIGQLSFVAADGAGRAPVRRGRASAPSTRASTGRRRAATGRTSSRVILVTGGTGFVGTNVVHALRARRPPRPALVREPRRAGRSTSWGCEIVEGDVTDPDSLRARRRGCDAVVHLVAIDRAAPKPSSGHGAGTRDLVAAAEGAGVQRFVLMSALGTSEAERRTRPVLPRQVGEGAGGHGSALEHVILRPSFVFGGDGGVLPQLARIVRLAPVTPVLGSGTQRLQPIWVEDLARAVALALGRVTTCWWTSAAPTSSTGTSSGRG